MKFLIVSLALAAVASAEHQAVLVKSEKSANILRQTAESSPDGSYAWKYETENGIFAEENGGLQAVGPNGEAGTYAEGGYQYTGDDGRVYTLTYKAGPNGFIAQGDHLPVAPPIPEAILRSLAYNAAHSHQEGAEYYKPEPAKPYYSQPIAVVATPKPLVYEGQYTPAKPYFASVKPTALPVLLSTPVPRPVGYPLQQVFPTPTPQAYYQPIGRR